MKLYNKAPLPFQGQKRNFLKEYKKIIATLSDDVVIVDLFGGSGLLSRAAKDVKPNATVVYNDYDGYVNRLADIERTNGIVHDIREILRDCPDKKLVEGNSREQVIEYLAECDAERSIDAITLSASILFSGKFAPDFKSLIKHSFYNRVIKSQYNADGYLDGLTVRHEDYRVLYNEYKDCSNVVFVLDPPYLCADTTSYQMSWKLKDYIGVISLLSNSRYIYFYSDRSEVVELFNALSGVFGLDNPFSGCKISSTKVSVNHSSFYQDYIAYKL